MRDNNSGYYGTWATLAGVAENLWPLLVVCTGKGPSSGRGLVGVVASTSSGDAFCGGAAFNKVLLP